MHRRNASVGGSRAAGQSLHLLLKATLVLTHWVISAVILPGCPIKGKVKYALRFKVVNTSKRRFQILL